MYSLGPHRLADEARDRLEEARLEGVLIISEPVYAELVPQFAGASELDEFLRYTGIQLRPLSRRAPVLAGQAWVQYIRGVTRLQCAGCGNRQTCRCETCGRVLGVRQHILSDFLVGAHAVANDSRLLSRDRGYFRTYFPTSRSPDSA
jgi:predicted nucleic acid-binding protein